MSRGRSGRGDGAGYQRGGTPGDIPGRPGVHRSQRNQYAAVTDLLAHGEIYGLVGGMSGVFFNETPLAPTPTSGDQSSPLSVIVTTGHQVNYNASSNTKEFSNASKIFENKTPLRRHVLITKAIALTTSSTIAAGANFIPTTGLDGTSGQPLSIRIMLDHCRRRGLHPRAWFTHSDGDFSVAIESTPVPVAAGQFGAGTGTPVNSPGGIRLLQTTMKRAIPSGATFYIDWGGLFSSVSADGGTLTFKDFTENTDWADGGIDYTASAYLTRIGQFSQSSPATIVVFPEQEGSLQVTETNKTFKDAFVKLRRGTRYQKGGGITKNSSPTSSFILTGSALGDELHMYNGIANASTQTYSGTDTLTTEAATLVGAGAFNFGQYTKKEVDSIDVDIEFPGGLFAAKADGSHKRVWVEHQIVFEYKRTDDDTDFNTV